MFQQPVRPDGHVHVEFKAGRMDWDGRMVTADKRKGKIVLYTAEEEELMHFQWLDREKNEVVMDLILINDAYLEKIEKCTTGRVYLLRFTSSSKKLFFWMQEPKAEGDADLIRRFNETIGAKIPEKPAGGATVQSTGGQAPSGMAVDAGPNQLRDILQQFLENNPAGAGGARTRTPPVPLGAVLTTDVLQGLLADEAAAAEMISLLPETHKSPEGLREVLTSPQLQQSLHSLSQAVHSDQLPVLMAGLGLNAGSISSAPPGSDALEVLFRAMEAQAGGSSNSTTAAPEAPAGDAAGAGGAGSGGEAPGSG